MCMHKLWLCVLQRKRYEDCLTQNKPGNYLTCVAILCHTCPCKHNVTATFVIRLKQLYSLTNTSVIVILRPNGTFVIQDWSHSGPQEPALDSCALQARLYLILYTTHTYTHAQNCIRMHVNLNRITLPPKGRETKFIHSFIHSSNHFGLFTFGEEVKRPIVLQPVYPHPSSTLANFCSHAVLLRGESWNEKPHPSLPLLHYLPLPSSSNPPLLSKNNP